MYGSLREGVKVYLDSQQFVEFYQQLKNIIPQNAKRRKDKNWKNYILLFPLPNYAWLILMGLINMDMQIKVGSIFKSKA